jgi:MFS family permease
MGVGLPYLAKVRFGTPTAYAIVISAASAGGLLGALLAGLWRVKRRGILLLAACVIISLCVGSVGLWRPLWAIAASFFLMAISAGLANVQIAAWLQQRVEPAVRGRVFSVLMLASFGLMPVSLAVAGFLVALSLKVMFMIAGGAMLTVTVFGALHRQVREIQ